MREYTAHAKNFFQADSKALRRTAGGQIKMLENHLSAIRPPVRRADGKCVFDQLPVRPVRLSAKVPKPLIYQAFQGGQVKRGGRELLSAYIKNAHIHIKNEHWRTGGQQRTGRTGRTGRTANVQKTTPPADNTHRGKFSLFLFVYKADRFTPLHSTHLSICLLISTILIPPRSKPSAIRTRGGRGPLDIGTAIRIPPPFCTKNRRIDRACAGEKSQKARKQHAKRQGKTAVGLLRRLLCSAAAAPLRRLICSGRWSAPAAALLRPLVCSGRCSAPRLAAPAAGLLRGWLVYLLAAAAPLRLAGQLLRSGGWSAAGGG